MPHRFVPLICCARCGMIRRGDAPKCSGMNLQKEPCEGTIGFPLVIDLQRQNTYVDLLRNVEPFDPEDDKKIIVANSEDVPPPTKPPPKKGPPTLRLEP